MKRIHSLKDIIEFNSSFKTAINLYLSLNKPEKVLGYIPTKSSINFMGEYMSAVLDNKEQATLLIGPYGKGKSHLLLVLLAVLTMERTAENKEIICRLISKVKEIDEIGVDITQKITKIWDDKRFLPVLISNLTGDLNQAFLYGLNDALKREKITNLVPDTYYSIAESRLKDWKVNYVDTYLFFEQELAKKNMNMSALLAGLRMYSKDALETFASIYPMVTAGSEFNPMAVSDVIPLYKSLSEKLVEEYGYSGIYIVFDEFSKFIESQDGIAAGSNMKLIQDICELATDSQNSQIFITMVAHKSIKEYGKYLSTDIINSFTGIEGRLIEKYFITSSKNNYELIKNAIVKNNEFIKDMPHYDKLLGGTALKAYYQLPAFRSNFLEKEFDNIILKGCFPLNPISSYLLLNVSEKVAQNERTLFTFISSDEPHSMYRFVSEHTLQKEWGIGADLIYDYFSSLFKKEVVNEYIHNLWLSAEYAIDKCDTENQKKIIKALAIVLIVNKEDEIPSNEKYLSLCVNSEDNAQAIKDLVEKQLIYRKSSTGTYVFKTRAGSELKNEIKRQRELKGESVDYSEVLADVTGKYYVIPRKYNTLHMMTRFFANQFMEVEDFLSIESANILYSDCEADGKVITLFSFTGIKQDLVIKHIQKLSDKRLVVVCPKKGLKAKKQLRDYEIIRNLRNNIVFTNNNEILKKELPLLVDDLTRELEDIISNIYEDDDNTRVLFFDGEKVKNNKVGNEEVAVNYCCENIYFKTPIINNEMVNRSEINTAQTRKARLNIINAVLNHNDDTEFYSGSNQEATVYRAVFCRTGLLDGTADSPLQEVIDEINSFVNSCSDTKMPMSKLIEKLIAEPYGLRLGVVPMYLAYVLARRREDIIIYFFNKEVQLNADIVVNMCEQSSDYSVYVSKEDLQKEKYVSELNVLFQVGDNRNLSANRIKDIFICMQRWFRALPQVSRNAVNLQDYVTTENKVREMKEIRQALQKAEYNPFEILFVTFPNEFGVNTLEETYHLIDECKTFYDDYFDWIQQETVNKIYAVWGGKRKLDLFHMLKEWYEKQSKRSKQGLYSGRMTNFMSCIENMDVYYDTDVAQKVVKAVTDVYMENWTAGSLEEFNKELISLKNEIETIRDEVLTGEMTLTFTGRKGNTINKLYSYADENSGSVLRNIIEDTLDEYDDLSANDRVSILLEMIEKIIK